MTSTFSFLVPGGILLLQVGLKNSFTLHWRIQDEAAVISFIGIRIILVKH